MYRSSSWNRATEDYSSAPPKGLWMGSMIGPLDEDEPPSYNNPPADEMVKKEKSPAKFAEKAIHIIPFVLLACALVLWLFSNPDVVDVGMREESIAARIEGLTIEGDIDNDSDGTQTGFLGATLELNGDSDKTNYADRNRRASRKLIKGFY
ncbi:unnamed protein product [Eruca vesicaria subsp. sativa]|uniref:Transmembrane protein n=1 Tax=Eruca vesicaria subsp. sativa TaxID=29727 RepID=A0ABC8KU50_ERUVS|nr:unnamed protein product [Eruca vesicaria subsp. sativa]